MSALTPRVADLILDATINAPKSFSIAAMLGPELAAAYEDLQDRLRDRIIKLWQTELNARRGKQGAIREDLARIEVVELRHERSRSLDPHKHRHLWLTVKVQGVDGKWSNIDTRVALRFQNVVNAEGDLASRTPSTVPGTSGPREPSVAIEFSDLEVQGPPRRRALPSSSDRTLATGSGISTRGLQPPAPPS